MDYIFRWLELRFVTGRQYPLFKDMVLPGAAALSAEPLAISEGSAAVISGQHSAFSHSQTSNETTPPQGGVAGSQQPAASGSPSIVDRGLFHSADALKEFVDLGDAPSCHVCGAIMTRNGSCYRCMSCGSTSGCS
jgi:ribonucleoside-diphosphate reductase alpha chain